MSGKPGMRGRKDVMYRSFRIREIFESGIDVTTTLIMNEFKITKQSAQKWIDVAGLFMPVCEVREQYSGGNKRKVYGLLKD